MPIFVYKAKKGPQEIIEGTLEAETREVAIAKIDQMGFVPIRVTVLRNLLGKETKGAKESEIKPFTHISLFQRVRPRDVTVFTEQLASLVRSKVPLFEAINILSTQTENTILKKIISSISSELREGKTLSKSLSKYPQVFPSLYINMVSSGEAGGILDETLTRIAKFRQEEEELRSKISAALAYPIFIIIVGLITILLLLTFGIPRLVSLFNEVGQSLPLPTQILISLSRGIRSYWYWILLAVVFLIFLLRRRKATNKEKIIFDRFKLRLPVVGNLLKKSLLARFARTFATLLANGIPVFQALEITLPALDNEIFRMELEKVHSDIIAGSSFDQSMKKSLWFPSFMINMIAVGEKGGNLKDALLEISNFYEHEVNTIMKLITSLLEPIIILVMGLLVTFIVLAMLLPIFQINIGMG